jgi:hypothetical protein
MTSETYPLPSWADFEWEDPKPGLRNGGGRLDWRPIMAHLDTNPGQWARVRRSEKAARFGKNTCEKLSEQYPEYEFQSQTVEGESRLYARRKVEAEVTA